MAVSAEVFIARLFHLANLAHWIWGAIVAAQNKGAQDLSPNLWAYVVTDTVLHAVCFTGVAVESKRKVRLCVCDWLAGSPVIALCHGSGLVETAITVRVCRLPLAAGDSCLLWLAFRLRSPSSGDPFCGRP